MSLRPPSGTPPPASADIGGLRLDLVVLAGAVCDRYRDRYPDEQDRYGDAGQDWCRHDNQWLLSWAVGDVLDVTDLDDQVRWLARVLQARGFPIDRLAENLRMAAGIVLERLAPQQGSALDAVLRRAALAVDALIVADVAPQGDG